MNNQGFTLVELIVSVALIGIFIPAIMKGLSFSLAETRQGEQISAGWALARQGMESIYDQKTDWSWDATSPTNGTTTTTPQLPYTRNVTIGPAYRCAGTLCQSTDAGATSDLTTRYITVIVSWPENGSVQSVSLNSYVTQH